jgi:dTMP kinase
LLAARAQHVAEVIAPALQAGRDVVCDRFTGSTVAYQGYGRGLDPAEVTCLSRWACAGIEPDRVVLLQITAPEAAERLARRTGELDRMEGQGAAFFAKVGEGYAAQAAADPLHWRVVDGEGSEDEVATRVLQAVRI